MASDRTSAETQNSFLECSICHENKKGRNPKGLHCQHSFCCDCLIEWFKTKEGRNEISCPVCRVVTKLPEDGIKGLPVDFKIEEFDALLSAFKDPKFCQACPPGNPRYLASVMCKTCDRRLCDDCHKYHLSCELFSDHEMVPFEHVCSQHGKILSHFCIDCFQGVCLECLLWRAHDKHDVQKLSACIMQVKKTFLADKNELTNTCGEFKTSLAEAKAEEMKKLDEFKSSLLRKAKCMIEDIDEKVCKAVNICHSEEAKTLGELMTDFEKDNLPDEEFCKDLENILDLSNEGMAWEMSKKRDEVIEATEKIKSVTKDEYPDPKWPEEYSELLDADDIWTVLKELNHFLLPPIDEKMGEPELVFEKLFDENKKIGTPCHLEVLSDGSALVALKGENHVKRVDTKGNIIRHYNATNAGSGNLCFTTDNKKVYIVCNDGSDLIKMDIETCWMDIEIGQLSMIPYAMTYEPQRHILILSNAEKVREFNIEEHKRYRRDLPCGFLRILRNDRLFHTIVFGEEAALVYINGKLIQTIHYVPEKFIKLNDVAYFGRGIFLMLSTAAQKIVRYDMKNQCFLDDLLTQEDGLGVPKFIACNFPYLWVAGIHIPDASDEQMHGYLKLYKWCT